MICEACRRDRDKYAKGLCRSCYSETIRRRGTCSECGGRTCRVSYTICQPCRNKIEKPHLGHHHSEDVRKVISEKVAGKLTGNKHPQWKGGITPLNQRIRGSVKYKQWRDEVFKRDDYTCQSCGKRGGDMNADHILPFFAFPKLRLDVNNGRTLCVECHRATKTYGRQVLQFQLP